MTIRLMLVDDHAKVHRVISGLVSSLPDIQIVAIASSGEDAVQFSDEYIPDLILMDVVMAGMGGIKATEQIMEKHPHIKVLALSSFYDQETIRMMLKAGAVGYVLKDTSLSDLEHTIRTVANGKSVLSAEVTQILLQPAQTDPRSYGLTPRELDVLRLMVEGLNNSEISDSLSISVSTTKYHVSSILNKLDVTGRVEAVALAVEKHLIS